MQASKENSPSTETSSDLLPPLNSELGHNMLQYYNLDPNYINTNNGSYGTTPKYVLKAKEKYEDEFEARPDLFYGHIHSTLFQSRREIIAQYVDADPEDLVFVNNATEANACILNSLNYQPGDIILMYDFVYNAVKSLCNSLVDKHQVVLVSMETNQKVLNSRESLVKIAQEHIEKYRNKIKIAILDYISSMPCVVVPVEELIPLFRKHGILSMVDAAHAFNQLDFSIRKMDPDFLHCNIHKWSPMPKGLSLMYVKKELQSMIHPAILSRGFKQGYFEEFVRLGTRDFSSIYCVKEAMEFIERLGGKRRINDYCRSLVQKVGDKVKEIWKTELLVADYEMLPYMVNVITPYQQDDIWDKLDVKKVLETAKTIFQLGKYKDIWYIRFSCTVYNELGDYENAAKVVLDILEGRL